MNERSDAGDILSQVKVPIFSDDDAGTLYSRLATTAAGQMHSFVPLLVSGEFTVAKQDDAQSNVWRRRDESDGFIDWRMSAEAIHNLVRGLTKPYVGASFFYEGQSIKVWKSKIKQHDLANIEPGKILIVNGDAVLVKAGKDAIWLLDCMPMPHFKVGSYL